MLHGYKIPLRLILVIIIFSAVEIFPQSAGSLSGKIIDSQTGEELIGANIILDETTIGAASDIEGNFKLPALNPGVYNVTATMVGYAKFKITNLEIKPGENVKIEIKLTPQTIITDEIVITARMILDNEASLLKNRQKSYSFSDAIGSDIIKKSGSDDAGDAIKKVVGTSVVDGKYVYIRGLGDRYSVTQLNGTELPGADPNKKSFQMDLIPANLLDNIVTVKNFTPDKPGNFSGGLVDIGIKSFPDKFTFKISGGTSYNSQANFNSNFLSYIGGETDWLGIDDGFRKLPAVFNNPELVIPSVQSARYDNEKAAILDEVSKSFNSIMDVKRAAPSANSNFSISAGDNISTGEESSIGYIGSFTYRQSYKFYENGETGRYTLNHGSEVLNPLLLLNDNKGVSEANWGGLFTLTYNLNPGNQFGGRFFYSKSGISATRFMTGKWPQEFGQGANTPLYTNRVLHWMERDIKSYQLRGEHSLNNFFVSNLSWSASVSRTQQNEPDFRLITSYTTYRPQDTTYTITGSNFDDPSRYFRNLNDNNNSINLDASFPFVQWNGYNSKFKLGVHYQYSDRQFTEKIITYSPDRNIFNEYKGNLSALFNNQNNGITNTETLNNGTTRYTFGNTVYDRSFPKNNYSGEQNIYAVYGMVELPVLNDLKFLGGARYETTALSVLSKDPQIPEGKIDEQDILPSVNLIYNITEEMNLRIAASQTLARPTFREIAPFSSKDFVNDVELTGNPDLERTLIENYDLRWEWYLMPGEIIAVSGFYKLLKNPIEVGFVEASTRSNPIINYTNVDEAELFGAEFEMRLGLGYLSEQLNNFNIGINVSVVNSIVDIAEDELEQRRGIDPDAPSTRQLQGQSPYTLNIDLTYSNDNWGTIMGLYFNSFGERLSKVSSNITPDVFEQPSPLINFTLNQEVFEVLTFSFGIKNILNSEYEEIYKYNNKKYVYQAYTYGVSYTAGISYNL